MFYQEKKILTLVFHPALIVVAGMLQVSADELVSALTTDIQYVKGTFFQYFDFHLYSPLVFFEIQ